MLSKAVKRRIENNKYKRSYLGRQRLRRQYQEITAMLRSIQEYKDSHAQQESEGTPSA